MKPDDYGTLIKYTANTFNTLSQGNTNAAKTDKTAEVIQAATEALQMFFQIGENRADVDSKAAEITNLNNSADTVKKNTDKAVEKFNQEIKDLQAKIEENLDKVEEKNKEKEEIRNDMQKQTEIIANAQNILNTSKDGKERCQAIRDLQDAKGVIKDLVTKSAKLVKEIEAGIGEIQDYQGKVEDIHVEADETVEASQEECEKLSAEADTSLQQNKVLEQKGQQEIVQGQLKAAGGTLAAVFGGEVEAAEGAEMIIEGKYTVGKATANISQIKTTSGAIRTNLAQMTPDKVGIGEAKDAAISAAEQVQSAWGLLGIWTTEYSETLTTEQKEFNAAVDSAAAIVNKEVEANAKQDGSISEPQKAELGIKEGSSNIESNKDEELPQYTLDKNTDVKETFTYDVSKLQQLL